MASLDELGDAQEIDWAEIIGDNDAFEGIRSFDFPPFYHLTDFESLDFLCFLTILKEPDGDEMPGQSFDWLDLYVDTNKRKEVVQHFVRFRDHLKQLRRLRDLGIV